MSSMESPFRSVMARSSGMGPAAYVVYPCELKVCPRRGIGAAEARARDAMTPELKNRVDSMVLSPCAPMASRDPQGLNRDFNTPRNATQSFLRRSARSNAGGALLDDEVADRERIEA